MTPRKPLIVAPMSDRSDPGARAIDSNADSNAAERERAPADVGGIPRFCVLQFCPRPRVAEGDDPRRLE